jgi:hypothetical protein
MGDVFQSLDWVFVPTPGTNVSSIASAHRRAASVFMWPLVEGLIEPFAAHANPQTGLFPALRMYFGIISRELQI